jgi:3-phosphoshikimate 1-carboxyvinyltransferase
MVNVTVRKTSKLQGQVCAPPSKSYTQRMLIASALSSGTGKVSNPLLSEDTQATYRAITALGAKVQTTESCWTIQGANPLKAAKEPIDVGESGATLRFMIPIAALASGCSAFLLGSSLEHRPIEPLLNSLHELGVKAYPEQLGDKSVIVVEGNSIAGGKTAMPGDVSSQFISGLMFACPMAKKDTEITLTTPLESKDYVKMTKEVLTQHQIKIEIDDNFKHINIPSNQTYKQTDSKVPGDFSSAAFLLSAAAITKSEVQINNLNYASAQGDKAILGILKQMGVKGKVCKDSIEIEGSGGLLKAIDIDAKNIPDLVPICATLACYAQGPSKIYNASRLRFKESDRLASVYAELTKMGAQIEMDENSLTVKGPCQLHGANVDPHNDHRIAMACAVAALGVDGETTIENAECVRKSYPLFFTDLKSIGVDIVGGKFDR